MGKKLYLSNAPDVKVDGLWVKSIHVSVNVYQRTRSSVLWKNMTSRCRSREEYEDCTVEFKSFQEFAEWCQTQEGYLEKSGDRFWQLDKDFMNPAERVYSKETCMFVPSDVNLFLKEMRNGSGLRGTSISKRKKGPDVYRCTGFKGALTFKTEIEAHKAWQVWKLETAKVLLDKYKKFEKLSKCLKGWISDFEEKMASGQPIV